MLETLLYMYLGETAFVWIEGIVHQILIDRKLKKEGYKSTQRKSFSLGDVFLTVIVIILHSIPVVNLIFPLSHIPFHRAYDEHKNYLLDAGAIEEPDEKIEKEEKKEVDKKPTYVKSKTEHEVYRPINVDETEYSHNHGFTLKKNYHRRMH